MAILCCCAKFRSLWEWDKFKHFGKSFCKLQHMSKGQLLFGDIDKYDQGKSKYNFFLMADGEVGGFKEHKLRDIFYGCGKINHVSLI